MYTGNPKGNAIDRIRIAVGDADCSYEFLDDETYSYFLEKNNNKEGPTILDVAKCILFSLARRCRERAGDVEVYGAEMFSNYERALKLIIKDPALSYISAMPYCGGISRTDMQANVNDLDTPDATIYRGFQAGVPAYFDKTLWGNVNTTSGML